jgi:TRAP-type C4-dicarboxylate transport system permease small subunit
MIIDVYHRVASKGAAVAGVFLLGMMGLTVANVIFRFFGHVIAGTYELTEAMNVVVIGCAFVYTVLHGSQVAVILVFSRLPVPIRKILEPFNNLLGTIFWWVIAWASFKIMIERWQIEKTELLEVPFFPFRVVWVYGLIFVGLVYFTRLLLSLIKRGKSDPN